jgi:hypothetical protein
MTSSSKHSRGADILILHSYGMFRHMQEGTPKLQLASIQTSKRARQPVMIKGKHFAIAHRLLQCDVIMILKKLQKTET